MLDILRWADLKPGEYGTLGDMVLPFTIGDSDRGGRCVRDSEAEVVMEVNGAFRD